MKIKKNQIALELIKLDYCFQILINYFFKFSSKTRNFAEKKRRRVPVDKINETVDKIVGMVIGQASRHQAVKDDVSISIQNAIKDVIAKDLQPDEESGFSFTEYNHLEIYQGPTKLLTLPDETTSTDAAAADGDKANANANNNDSTSRGQLAHGEIIVKVKIRVHLFEILDIAN